MKIKTLNLILMTAGTLTGCSSISDKKPNIVFILVDDMGYGDVSVNNPYSKVSTPAIDKLAEEGMRFTEAHSAGSVSTPSRYGLITGQYFFRAPKQKGYWGFLPPHIESNRETIGSLMQNDGYTTACIGKWHLGLNWQKKNSNIPIRTNDTPKTGLTNVDFSQPISGGPNDLGFDYSFILPGSLDMPPYVFVKNNYVVDPEIILTADVYPHSLNQTVYSWDRKHTKENDVYWKRGVWWRNGEMSKSFKIETCLNTIVDEGLSFIEREGKKDKPFFLYLPLSAPHTPWMPNEKFKNTTNLGTYGEFISQIDHSVEQIVKKITDMGIEENTIIIFSSDNGASWKEEDILQYAHQSSGDRKGMKGDAWDGGHHVPLIIKWPKKIKQKSVYNHDVSLVDFYATFAELTKQEVKKGTAVDSYSFFKVLIGKQTKASRDQIVYISSSGRLAIKKGDWKFIEGLGSAGFSEPTKLEPMKNGPTDQLYNMKKDASETNNISLEHPEKTEELKLLLEKVVQNQYRDKQSIANLNLKPSILIKIFN